MEEAAKELEDKKKLEEGNSELELLASQLVDAAPHADPRISAAVKINAILKKRRTSKK